VTGGAAAIDVVVDATAQATVTICLRNPRRAEEDIWRANSWGENASVPIPNNRPLH